MSSQDSTRYRMLLIMIGAVIAAIGLGFILQ